MGLNADVLDDLPDTPIVDGDLIAPPSDIPKSKESITIVPENDEVKAEGPIPQEQLEKLPTMDVAFKLVEDGQSKVVQLKDVESEILAQESINRHGAEYISAAFEGFLSGPVRLNEFTVGLSKTNYGYAVKQMATAVAKEEAAVVSNFQLLIDQPLSDAKAILEQLVASYIPAVRSMLYELRGQTLGLNEKLAANKNVVVPMEGQFVNLLKVDLRSLDASKMEGLSIDVKKLDASVRSIQQLLKCPWVNALVWSALEGKGFDNVKNPETRMSYIDCPLTVVELVKFFSSDIDAIIDEVVKDSQEAIQCLSDVQVKSDEHKDKPEAIKAYINEAMPTMQGCFKTVSSTAHFVNDLAKLSFSSSCLFDFYASL